MLRDIDWRKYTQGRQREEKNSVTNQLPIR